MLSSYYFYSNEIGKYTFRFKRFNCKLCVYISYHYKENFDAFDTWELCEIKDGKIEPIDSDFFTPRHQDAQNYINRLIKLKAFL